MKKVTITLTLNLKKDKIDSKLQDGIRNMLLLKKIIKIINLVMLDIDKHEKKILGVGYENKKKETEDKWNQLNLIDIQSLLANNHRLPLSHMAKSFIWLE